ncbi:MAG: exodeoxyribonuclease V subunit alpha [Chlorobiaceae bacterium]|nr:exodeoxyribonuclease V subunit alpha [Chlorobiaceae bacterium]
MSIEFHERLIDRHFAAFITGSSGNERDLFSLLVSMLSSSVGDGNTCLNLREVAEERVIVDGTVFDFPAIDELRGLVVQSSAAGVPGQFRPLVLDDAGRLYLYRYWRYEHDLASLLLEKARGEDCRVEDKLPDDTLVRMFPESSEGDSSRQKEAAAVALCRQLCVISGGPGTGKTSTVVRILALLLEQHNGLKLNIAMAAPTGKAAARLKASVSALRQVLDCSDNVRNAIPDNVVTIHRLLGTLSGTDRFRHSALNPLAFDIVVVDEASMIALPLMTALLRALKPGARLILLGDRDQLASVEAGAVLGDICRAGELFPDSPLGQSMVMLEKNFRFKEKSGIGELSSRVNAGRGVDALQLLTNSAQERLTWQSVSSREELRRLLPESVVEGYSCSFKAATPGEALEQFDRFRILCALRDGPFGVSGINGYVESTLRRANLISGIEANYRCRPILVTANDHTLQLFNGDTGILFPDPDYGGELRAFFPSSDGGIRSLAPIRVPHHESAFAMTVHKSQGSEFERILLILPPTESDILTRALLYTAITRAKASVEIWGDKEVFVKAVSRKSERHSGLADALLSAVEVC